MAARQRFRWKGTSSSTGIKLSKATSLDSGGDMMYHPLLPHHAAATAGPAGTVHAAAAYPSQPRAAHTHHHHIAADLIHSTLHSQPRHSRYQALLQEGADFYVATVVALWHNFIVKYIAQRHCQIYCATPSFVFLKNFNQNPCSRILLDGAWSIEKKTSNPIIQV